MENTVGHDRTPVVSSQLHSMESRRVIWAAAASAGIYPWVLDAFHWAVSPVAADSLAMAASLSRLVVAALMLFSAFAVPLICLLLASRPSGAVAGGTARARRFALIAMTAPTFYVFFGVLTYMSGSTIPDGWLWTPAWLLLAYWTLSKGPSEVAPQSSTPSHLRVAHGICGSIAALYVLFHIINHLFGLIGSEAHATVMDIGRVVYRSPFVEPLLVMVMLFQMVSGLRLVWIWTETSQDRYRIYQLASGVFMSVFILGHMNSVFIFARTFLAIPTDWAFATGLPTGLIQDPWNIRLIPHYALGVFFVLTHLCSGLRVVMLAHGVKKPTADWLWWAGAGLSALLSLAIILGMTGYRLI